MITSRSDLDRGRELGVEPGIRRIHNLQGGANVGTPWLSEEDIGQEELPSLSICLSI